MNTPAYYNVPPYGDVMELIDAIGDRDADVERPSDWTKRFNALKYVIRAPRKGGVEDLRKAIDYLQRLVDGLEGREGPDADARGLEELERVLEEFEAGLDGGVGMPELMHGPEQLEDDINVDGWELIADDANLSVCDYMCTPEERGRCGKSGTELVCSRLMATDLVRRCKKLAGVE